MSMHNHSSNSNNGRRNGKNAIRCRAGEMPRWSNGVLLNPANSRTDRSSTPRTNDSGRTRSPSLPAVPQAKVGKFVFQDLGYGRRNPVLVMTKREVQKGFQAPYNSKFERTKSSGKGSDFVASFRVHGRPVFLDRNSAKPTDLSKVYGFELVGENPSCSVYFCRIITPDSFKGPSSITIDVRTGKMVANNARFFKPSSFKTKRPVASLPVSDNRDAFEVADDAVDWFGDTFGDFDSAPFNFESGTFFSMEHISYRETALLSGFACDDCDEDGDDCACGNHDIEAASFFELEVAEKSAIRPMNATWCHSCGCRICECDGTSQVDGQPWLMPAHLTQVRFPAYVAPRRPRTKRYAWM